MAGRWAVPEEPGITQRGTCRFSVVCRSASEIEVSDIGLFCLLLLFFGSPPWAKEVVPSLTLSLLLQFSSLHLHSQEQGWKICDSKINLSEGSAFLAPGWGWGTCRCNFLGAA